MGKKKKNEIKPWCWYCDRDFEDEKVLINHQKAKHLKCSICNKKLNTAGGLIIHTTQVHKEPLTKVPNALPGRDDPNIEIFGMEGVPDADLQAHLAEVDAASGGPASKKPKIAVLDENQIKAQLSQWRAAQESFGMPPNSTSGMPFSTLVAPHMPGMHISAPPQFAPMYQMMPHMHPMGPGGPMPYGQPPLPHMMPGMPPMMPFGMPPGGMPRMPYGMLPPPIGATPFMPPALGGPPPLPGLSPQPPPSARSIESAASPSRAPPVGNGIGSSNTPNASTAGESTATSSTSHQTPAVSGATSAVPVRQPGEPYLIYPDNEISVEEKRARHSKYRCVETANA